jgi:hypothetical protein
MLEEINGKAIKMLNPIINIQLTECDELVAAKTVCNIFFS